MGTGGGHRPKAVGGWREVPTAFARPRGLRPGDPVAVVAPASAFDRPSFETGLAVLATRYRPLYGADLFARTRYLAGDDSRRLAELDAALTDEEVRAVFVARGGYGSMRLLPRLALDAGAPGKPLVGFSDVTALHLALQAAGRVSIHGPVVTQLGTQPGEVAARLFHLLESATEAAPALTGTPLVSGVVEGPLVGGNLSLVTRLLGTAWLPPLDGAVLLLEDVSERPYRLDRMWTHLALAGAFARVRGLVLGEFAQCEEPEADYTGAEVVADLARETGLPCVADLPIGHGVVNVPVPLGVRVRLDGDTGRLTFLTPAVAPA